MKIIFILLPEKLVINVTGFEPEVFGAREDGIYITNRSRMNITYNKSRKLEYKDNHLYLNNGIYTVEYYGQDTNKISLAYVREELVSWLDENAFFGTNKPLPRLEKDAEANMLRLYNKQGTFTYIPSYQVDTIGKIIKKEIPIWKDHRFDYVWNTVLESQVDNMRIERLEVEENNEI